MIDKVTIDRIAKLHPKLREEALQIYNEIACALKTVTCRFTDTYRSIEEQRKIYAIGRTVPGEIKTKAQPGLSYHNYGLAVDASFIRNGILVYDVKTDFDGDGKSDWMEMVAIFKKYGWRWGADWDNDGITKEMGDKDEHLVDAPHFEKSFGHSTHDLLALYNAGKIDKEGYVLI